MIKNVIIVVVVLVVLFVFFKLGFSNGNKEEKVLEEIPQKYQNYQSISDSLRTEKYQLESFNQGKYKLTQIVHFNTTDSTLVVMGSNYGAPAQSLPKPIIHNYYKLDAQGNVLDSLELSGEETALTRDGYLVGLNYHCSWMLDGNATKKPYQILNDSIDWNADKDLETFQKLYATATRVMYSTFHIKTERYTAIKLRNNGVWTVTQSPDGFDNAFRFETYPEKPIIQYGTHPTTKPSEVDGFQHSHVPNLAEEGDSYKGENEHLSMVHFRKVKFEESKNNGAFNPNNMTYAAKWEGEGYMHLFYKGDTIPFKIALDKMKLEEDGYGREYGHPLRFYTNEQLNFGIVSENYGGLFLIKPVQ